MQNLSALSWKLASSLIVTARTPIQSSQCGLQILMLARNSKSKFMPNAHVFPGGAISEADFSLDWLNLYKSRGYGNLISSLPVVNQSDSERPPMLRNLSDEELLNTGIALRICAIRETFEECGIMVMKGDNFNFKKSREKLHNWRKVVRKDASKFLECCEDLGIIPDIWSLYEWSNWLTPNHMPAMHSNKRFDTAFYVTCLQKPPPVTQDDEEIVLSYWDPPEAVLDKYISKSMWLAPPQIYEILRLMNFKTLDELSEFALERSTRGCSQWLPVRVKCDDGVVALLPGDSHYPLDNDIEGKLPPLDVTGTVYEQRQSAKHLHRFEMKGPFDTKLLCNISQEYGHVDPFPEGSITAEA